MLFVSGKATDTGLVDTASKEVCMIEMMCVHDNQVTGLCIECLDIRKCWHSRLVIVRWFTVHEGK